MPSSLQLEAGPVPLTRPPHADAANRTTARTRRFARSPPCRRFPSAPAAKTGGSERTGRASAKYPTEWTSRPVVVANAKRAALVESFLARAAGVVGLSSASRLRSDRTGPRHQLRIRFRTLRNYSGPSAHRRMRRYMQFCPRDTTNIPLPGKTASCLRRNKNRLRSCAGRFASRRRCHYSPFHRLDSTLRSMQLSPRPSRCRSRSGRLLPSRKLSRIHRSCSGRSARSRRQVEPAPPR
jgi:hypothetical protein